MRMMKLLASIGLLLIWLSGMLATEGQEAVTAMLAIPGILLAATAGVIHDRILEKQGSYWVEYEDEDDEYDGEETVERFPEAKGEYRRDKQVRSA